MAKKKPGAKLKLTNELIDKAETLLINGNFVIKICEVLGIDQVTWYRWYNEGEEYSQLPEEEFNKIEHAEIKCKFYNRIRKATAMAEVEAVNMLMRQRKEHWQANAWFLERRYNKEWGKKETQKLEHTGQDGEPIKQQIDFSKLTDEELSTLEQIISKGTDN